MKHKKIIFTIMLLTIIFCIYLLIATTFLTIGTMKYNEASEYMLEHGINSEYHEIKKSAIYWSNLGRRMFFQEQVFCTLLDRLNEEGADITKTDEYFRVRYFSNGKEIYNTGAVSWLWLIENGYIIDGEMAEMNHRVVASKLHEYGINFYPLYKSGSLFFSPSYHAHIAVQLEAYY